MEENVSFYFLEKSVIFIFKILEDFFGGRRFRIEGRFLRGSGGNSLWSLFLEFGFCFLDFI